MRTATIALLAPLAVVLVGCPASLDDRCSEGACAPRADVDGGTKPPIDLPPGCTLGQTPKDSMACVDDKVGVFVSDGTGNDSNPGTIGQPVKSIAAAVSLATSQKKPNIYVCTGNYTSSVDLRTATSLYGGLDCTFKALSGDRPHWTAASPAFALRIADVNDPVVVADFLIDGAAGKTDGESSIAVFVSGSKSVRFARVDVTAGDGKPGTGATAMTRVAKPAKAAQGGNDSVLTGGPGASNTCADGTSTGGTGGKGGLSVEATDGLPTRPGSGGHGAGGDTACTTTGPGKTGANGADGVDATTPGAVGSLTPSGWTPQKGEAGKDGHLGQGGGGGGANQSGGGGGGAGGCGGSGGGGGTGGGASIALVVLQSTLALDTCVLVSGRAGNGGSGAAGQLGQEGGLGGDGGTSANYSGCHGGIGGTGGNGGAGAGGAGGVAPAILRMGANVELAGTTTTPGTFGQGGTGGKPTVNDGPTTASQAQLSL